MQIVCSRNTLICLSHFTFRHFIHFHFFDSTLPVASLVKGWRWKWMQRKRRKSTSGLNWNLRVWLPLRLLQVNPNASSVSPKWNSTVDSSTVPSPSKTSKCFSHIPVTSSSEMSSFQVVEGLWSPSKQRMASKTSPSKSRMDSMDFLEVQR